MFWDFSKSLNVSNQWLIILNNEHLGGYKLLSSSRVWDSTNLCLMCFLYRSPWSDVVSVMTYGLPPSSPDPPRLLKATTHSLHLTWELQPTSHGSTAASSKPILRYQLEMQEGEARQHFKKVFDDDATQYLVEGLRRCCLYRFRLAASNVDGISHWSDIVAFRTAPDLPTAPKGLRVSFPYSLPNNPIENLQIVWY